MPQKKSSKDRGSLLAVAGGLMVGAGYVIADSFKEREKRQRKEEEEERAQRERERQRKEREKAQWEQEQKDTDRQIRASHHMGGPRAPRAESRERVRAPRHKVEPHRSQPQIGYSDKKMLGWR